MIITLLILIPVIIAVTGFIVFKGVQLGLRWQVEVRQEKPPTFDIPNPIAPIIEAKQEKAQQEQVEEVKSAFSEWVHGAEKR